jgi:branched-chain amino acid transport system permease protein
VTGRLRRMAPLAGAAVVLGLPLAFPGAYAASTLAQMLIFGIFAMSLDLLLGYAGLPSLGHAGLFAVGAYAAGIVALRLGPNLFLGLVAAAASSTLVAAGIGVLALRTRGISFLMLTLALSQMVASAAHQWTGLTGGSNGLAGIPRPTLGLGAPDAALASPVGFYYLVAVCFLGLYGLLRRTVRSPFGLALRGVRENETRMATLGYPTWRIKFLTFLLAGAVAGVAGALHAYANGYVGPTDADWVMSGNALIMTIVGGPATLVGPVLGAAAFVALQLVASLYTDRWESLAGLLFLLFVYLDCGGIAGLWRLAVGRLARRQKADAALAH